MEVFMNKIIANGVFKPIKIGSLVLTYSALILVLNIVLYKFSIGPSFFKITFSFFPLALSGYLFGPWWSSILALFSNVLCFTIFGSGSFHPLFLITALLSGFISGLFLYRKNVNLLSVIITQLLLMIPLSLFLNSWFIALVYGIDYHFVFLGRLWRNVGLIPIQIIMVYLLIKAFERRKLLAQYKFR